MTIKNVTQSQLLAMADGLLAAGQTTLAGQVLGLALKRSEPEQRQQIRTRIGLAASPTRRTQMTLKLLQTLEAQGVEKAFVADGLATWMKTLPFAEDERFMELAERHSGLLPLPNWHWNLQVALWAVKQARDLPGDLVELGVFRGHTTLFCAEYVDFQDWPKRWWLYDTFDGIPEDQQSPGWAKANENVYRGAYTLEEVTARFAHLPNISVIKGRAPEILLDQAPDVIAFLHVDMNNAPAEIGALDVLFERISRGGIVLFDDYCWHNARVQYEAEKAWFAARGLEVLPLPTGQGVFIRR